MENRQIWIVAFRSTLVLDSIVFAFKLAFAVWWIVETVHEGERWSARPEHSDTDNLHFFGPLFWYSGSVGMMVWTALRWVANVFMYRHENVGRGCYCCCTCCWVVIGALNLLHCGGMIVTDWCALTNQTFPACQWPKKVGIGFLVWEALVFGLMVIYEKKQ